MATKQATGDARTHNSVLNQGRELRGEGCASESGEGVEAL